MKKDLHCNDCINFISERECKIKGKGDFSYSSCEMLITKDGEVETNKIKTIKEFVKFLGENSLQLKTTKQGEHPFFFDHKEINPKPMSLWKMEIKYNVKIEGLINKEMPELIG